MVLQGVHGVESADNASSGHTYSEHGSGCLKLYSLTGDVVRSSRYLVSHSRVPRGWDPRCEIRNSVTLHTPLTRFAYASQIRDCLRVTDTHSYA